MQAYDLVMIVVLAGAVLFGAWKGLAWQVASLAAVFVSYFVACNFYQPFSQMIDTEEPWNKFLAMLILYIGTSLAIWISFGFVRKFIEQFELKGFDRHVGAMLGAVKGTLLCVVITLFAVTLLGENQTRTICNSSSGGYIAKAINRFEGYVPSEVHPVISPYIDRFNDAMDEHREEPVMVEQTNDSDATTNDLAENGGLFSPSTRISTNLPNIESSSREDTRTASSLNQGTASGSNPADVYYSPPHKPPIRRRW